MKLLYLLLAFLCSFQVAAQGTLATLDDKNGFRDVKFGTSPEAYPGMVHSFTSDGQATYRRKADPLLLGDVPITTINYTFTQGRLVRVRLRFVGPIDHEKVIKFLTYAYGNPTSTVNHVTNWEGNKVKLSFLNTTHGYGFITFDSKTMQEVMDRERAAQEKQRMDKAASDL